MNLNSDFINDHSVSVCIAEIRNSESPTTAQQFLLERYLHRLAKLAQQRLNGVQIVDGEDVAVSVLNRFFVAAPNDTSGAFSRIQDRNDLWPVLAQIATRKAINHFKKENALKRRGGKNVLDENSLVAQFDKVHLDQMIEKELTPQFADATFGDMEELIESIRKEDDQLYKILLLKLEGYTHQEIASKIGCVRRTIDRKLDRIRKILLSQE